MSYVGRGPGDPNGVRLARRQSEATEEACRLAECLAKQMRRAGLSDDQVTTIARELRVRAVEVREKAEGRVESRLVTKNTGHPLLEGRKSVYLYLDESGTSVFNANDEVFALAGVAMNEEDVIMYEEAVNKLKQKFFKRTDVQLHEPHMRNHRNYFSFGGKVEIQNEFDKAIRELVESTPFVAFGVGIRKASFAREFRDPGSDPYLPSGVYDLAIMLLMERFVDYLATSPERRIGRVHLESIGSRPDAEHQAAYADVLLHGTQFVPEKTFQSWVEAGCQFIPKCGTHPQELADLVAREVFEWTRSDCRDKPPYWDILLKKVYRRADCMYGKFGLKVFPASDIEDSVAATRADCGCTS